jgi:hypothetical protein
LATAAGAGRGGASVCTTSQMVGSRKATEPGTHMITPAIAWSSSAENAPSRAATA